MKRLLSLLLALLALFSLAACSTASDTADADKSEETRAVETLPIVSAPVETEPVTLEEHGSYTTKEDVALYIYTYGHLPDNFISKKQAQALGWPGGDLEPYAPGKCIGGSYFGNYEGILPDAPGRTYTECDIDTLGASNRGTKRIVFSNDGLIYYTEDHYKTFELLYEEETP
ncbi:MAG: ribonuclease domain-containing protein [Bacillota bacterium]|nr:ribonuclease domain-containing protein [Bacillota bacterium]